MDGLDLEGALTRSDGIHVDSLASPLVGERFHLLGWRVNANHVNQGRNLQYQRHRA